MSTLIDKWMAFRKEEGLTEQDVIRNSLNTMLSAHFDEQATSITAAQMEKAYERARSRMAKGKNSVVSVATHHNALRWTKVFWRWAVEKKYVRKNPSQDIKTVGRPNKRKPQIETLSELHAFRERAFAWAYHGDRPALGILIALYLGPRSNEVRRIEKRHVDRGAEFPRLVIPGTKSENAYRSVRVQSEELWNLLCAAADEATSPNERLIPSKRQTLLTRVKTLAAEAGLPPEAAKKLTFHSLRGMAASLATKGDAAGRAIADLLGQSSFAVTKAHYATENSQAEGRAKANLVMLEGGRAGMEKAPNPSQTEDARANQRNLSDQKAI